MSTKRIIAAAAASLFLTLGLGTLGVEPASAEICSDWTNPDGTHGTNCPKPSGGVSPTITLKRGMSRD